MISLPDFAALEAALSLPLDPILHRLLSERLANALACGVENMTHILVVEPSDVEENFLAEADFSPFYNPLLALRMGEEGFVPPWDWCGTPADGWFEWLTCIGNDGFALIVFVPMRGAIDDQLKKMIDMVDESLVPDDMSAVR